MSKHIVAPELFTLADEVGCFLEYWGFKAVHGKIWLLTLLAKHPVDSATIQDRFGISKALVSMTIKELIDHHVIEECGKSDRGTIIYKANFDFASIIGNVLRQREKKIFTRVKAALDSLSTVNTEDLNASGIDPKKVELLKKLVKQGESILDILLGPVLKGFKGIQKVSSAKGI